jgi:adenine-specific DNA-methyltransferase
MLRGSLEGTQTGLILRLQSTAFLNDPRMLENIAHGDSLRPETFEINFSQVMKEGGFDVIIGNPPYVRQETLGEEFKAYAKQNFETYAGTADLYIYFIEQAHKLLKPGGYFGMIVSNKWMRSNYGKALREFLKRESQLVEIIDFGELPVFGDVLAYPVIIITQRYSIDKHNIRYAKIENLDFESLPEEIIKAGIELKEYRFENDNWNLATSKEQDLLSKILKVGEPLGQFLDNQIYRGLLTGLNEAFIVDQQTYNNIVSTDQASKKFLKPFYMGRDVHKYFAENNGRYLICIPRGHTNLVKQPKQDGWLWLKKSYPGIANHLLPFEEKAKKRQDKGDYWWELRACDYYDKFTLPKIIAPAIVQNATFTFDANGFYSNDKTSIIVSDSLYVLGILNSGLSSYILKQIASTKQGGYFEQKPMYISQLPIRRIDFGNPDEKSAHDEIVKLVEKMLALQKERQSVRREDDLDRVRNLERQIAQVDGEIDQRVYALYGLTEEEVKVVEGG